LYLREGKVIRVDYTKPVAAEIGTVRKVEHFWLCGDCLKNHDVVFRSDTGVCVLPKQKGAGLSQGANGQAEPQPSHAPMKAQEPSKASKKSPLRAAATA